MTTKLQRAAEGIDKHLIEVALIDHLTQPLPLVLGPLEIAQYR
jgi:hypothetical protein